jgi:hypothetical protein
MRGYSTSIKQALFFFTLAGITLGVASLVSGALWTGPISTPPNSNVEAPINVGGISQVKDGALGVGSLAVFGNSYVQEKLGIGVINPAQKLDVSGYVRGSSGICIGNDCRTSWPETGIPTPPTCTGSNALQWSGSAWGCVAIQTTSPPKTYSSCTAKNVSNVGNCPATAHLGYCTIPSTTNYIDTCSSSYCTGANVDGKAQCIDGTWNVVNNLQNQTCYELGWWCSEAS